MWYSVSLARLSLPELFCLHIYVNIYVYYLCLCLSLVESRVLPALGLAWANQVMVRLMLRKLGGCVTSGEQNCVPRRLEVVFAPHLPRTSCLCGVWLEGVKGVPTEENARGEPQQPQQPVSTGKTRTSHGPEAGAEGLRDAREPSLYRTMRSELEPG